MAKRGLSVEDEVRAKQGPLDLIKLGESLIGDAILLNEADYVTDYSLVAQRLRELYTQAIHLNGWGLADPQLGGTQRIAVVIYRELWLPLVNPRVTPVLSSNEPGVDHDLAEEACLSIPGKRFLVKRSHRVQVRTFPYGPQEIVTVECSGELARIVQHEVDHLNGILIDAAGTEVKHDESS